MNRVMIGVAVATLSFASMAFAGVKTDYDRGANFERYRTFAWKIPERQAKSVVNNSLIAKRIEQEVNRDLTAKGLRQVRSNPDLYLTYHINAKNEKDLDYVPAWGRGRMGWYGGDVYVNRYVRGNAVIDVVDAHTNQLVWRAFLTNTGYHLADVQKDKTIDKMVDSAFKHFPPKQA